MQVCRSWMRLSRRRLRRRIVFHVDDHIALDRHVTQRAAYRAGVADRAAIAEARAPRQEYATAPGGLGGVVAVRVLLTRMALEHVDRVGEQTLTRVVEARLDR